ncbi:MAG: hypothetical protein GY749_35525 [Desulfobacteraceae bacterium]|nr:hypothetical protein [Desulfobacteraceae bacterium]
MMIGKWTPTDSDISLGRLPGFGMTINIINGGIECGWSRSGSVDDRIGYYNRFTGIFGIAPGDNLNCDTMTPF